MIVSLSRGCLTMTDLQTGFASLITRRSALAILVATMAEGTSAARASLVGGVKPGVRLVNSAGVRLETLFWGGSGPALLCLHGINSSAYIFSDLAPRLTRDFRVFGLTRRGHGRSDKPPAGYDLSTLTNDVLACIDRLGLDRVTLVGHSFAGLEMTSLAIQHPDRVSGLAFLDCSFDRRINATLGDPPPGPVPTDQDRATRGAFRAWLQRTYSPVWSRGWEADLEATVRFDEQGRYQGDAMPEEVGRLLYRAAANAPPVTSPIDKPAVAFFPFSTDYPSRLLGNGGIETLRAAAAYQARLNAAKEVHAEAFRAAFPQGRGLKVPSSDHYFFVTQGGLVAREVLALGHG